MPSTICRSVRQTPAPPMRTITSIGREILGSVTSSYLTNSFAVSFSSKAWSTAAFIYLSLPLIFLFCGDGIDALSPSKSARVVPRPSQADLSNVLWIATDPFRSASEQWLSPNCSATEQFGDNNSEQREIW